MSIISQFMHSPTESHLEVVYIILRYLKFTPEKGIMFKRSMEFSLEVYIDENYVGSILAERSNIRILFILRRKLGYLEK